MGMNDPFSSVGGSNMNGGSGHMMHDPFPPMGGSAPPNGMRDPFAAAPVAPTSASYDPFAALANPSYTSSSSQPMYGSTTQPPANDNPLFRF